MRILLVAHGYPPELEGGTEKSVQGLAHGLARRGHEVSVCAGSMDHAQGFQKSLAEDVDPESGARIAVHRIHRADLYFDHWQKSASSAVGAAFREILREVKPELVHVNHWIRLTRDLVRIAAEEHVPAVASLHDHWASCLITFRVRPDTKEFCEATLAPSPCLDCAALVPPRTPWVSRENLMLELLQRKGDLVRELELARVLCVPSRAHAENAMRFLGVDPERVQLEVVPHGRNLDFGSREPLAAPGPGRPLVLSSWGHLHPLKGPDLLLEALHRLEDPRAVRLHLAGGEVDPGFRARLGELSEGLDVEFHGPFVESELAQHPVAAAHFMVSGTRALESWGLVVDEALALGLPMILPRSGAFPERLQEGSGVLFYEPRDPDSLAQVLGRVLAQPDELTRVRGGLPRLEDVVPRQETHLARMLLIYERALAAGPPEVAARDWWQDRLRQQSEAAWDESLSRRDAAELGFE
jgi:glycosyltransferase involved in cell wall biosynthesis